MSVLFHMYTLFVVAEAEAAAEVVAGATASASYDEPTNNLCNETPNGIAIGLPITEIFDVIIYNSHLRKITHKICEAISPPSASTATLIISIDGAVVFKACNHITKHILERMILHKDIRCYPF